MMAKNQDTRLAKELSVGQHVHLVGRNLVGVFEVVSADHPKNPFFATNVTVQRLVTKKLLGFIPVGREKDGILIFLEPEEKVVII